MQAALIHKLDKEQERKQQGKKSKNQLNLYTHHTAPIILSKLSRNELNLLSAS